MTKANSPSDELFDLMYDQAEGRLSPEQTARLEALLLADPVKRQQYVDFSLLVCGLHCTRSERAETACNIEQPPMDAEPSCKLPADVQQPATPSIGLGAVPYVPKFDSLDRGAAFSYFVAVLILIAGALAAWGWTAPGSDKPLALAEAVPVTPTAATAPKPIIGRITGMANCQWASPEVAARDAAMGRFTLNSGLLELTYNNGVKVILEGPVKYAADSPNSGFLVVGKATIRIGEQSETAKPLAYAAPVGPAATADAASAPSLGCPFAALPSPFSAFAGPSFCLRANFAKIYDVRNAEFGVYVDKSKENQLYVFRGKIDFQLPYDAKIIRLEDTEWAFVRFDAAHTPWVHFGKAIKSPSSFARQLPKGAPFYSQDKKNKNDDVDFGDLPDS
jgi:hypothetical protein